MSREIRDIQYNMRQAVELSRRARGVANGASRSASIALTISLFSAIVVVLISIINLL